MERLADRYLLKERLGSGASATVWRALDEELGVERAVKVVEVPEGVDHASDRARLRSEARTMALLSHAHIVSVHDVGSDGDRDYIVMDLMTGGSLESRLDEHGPQDPEQVVYLGIQLLGALKAAHEKGVIHRDVKPANVLLDDKGQARLCDFGIAMASASTERHTKTGAALGSLPYMSPEQRQDARNVGPEADFYALGCTLYNALTCGSPVDLYLAPGQSPRWNGIPERLVPVIRRATSAKAEDRFRSASDFSRALLRSLGTQRPAQERAIEQPFAPRVDRRWAGLPGPVWVGIGMTVLLASVSYGLVLRVQEWKPPEPPSATSVVEEAVAPDLSGQWQGSFGGEPGAQLDVEQTDGEVVGRFTTPLGTNTRVSRVLGAWDTEAEQWVLRDEVQGPGSGRYTMRLNADGILVGRFDLGDGETVMRSALVRTGK